MKNMRNLNLLLRIVIPFIVSMIFIKHLPVYLYPLLLFTVVVSILNGYSCHIIAGRNDELKDMVKNNFAVNKELRETMQSNLEINKELHIFNSILVSKIDSLESRE